MEVTTQTDMQLSVAARILWGMGLTLMMIGLMVVIGMGFPAFRAMRMQPADTLHDE